MRLILHALLASLALAACAGPAPSSTTSRADSSPGATSPGIIPASAKTGAVFQLVQNQALLQCSAPTLHGLDMTGTKIWSKAFVDGEVSCTQAEIQNLAQVRVDHPHLALRNTLRFSGTPSRPVKVDCTFFGDLSIPLTKLSADDLGSHVVLRRPQQESYLDAAMAGRTDVLDSLDALVFDRLPIGKYEVALFREDLFKVTEPPYAQGYASVLPCQETVLALEGQ